MVSGLNRMSTPLPVQINEARQLIEQGDYKQAQKVLQRINHPLAEQWLRNLSRFTQTDAAPQPEQDVLADENVIRQVRYGQSLILQRDFLSAYEMLNNQPHTIARTWVMSYRLDLHEDLRNSWLDYFIPYIEDEALHFKSRTDLLGSRRFSMALDAIYWAEMHRATAIIDSVEFSIQLWWHYWLVHKLTTSTWKYDIRIRTYRSILQLLEDVGANSRNKDTLKKIYQEGKPADPDNQHNSVFEAVYGDSSNIRWVPNSTWSIPLEHLDYQTEQIQAVPTPTPRRNEESPNKKGILQRLIGHFKK